MWRRYLRWFEVAAFLLLIASATLFAQTSSGTLRGSVADPAGAVIPGAVVTAISTQGHKTSSVTDNVCNYEIKGLDPGTYTVNANAKGFSVSQQQNVAVAPGQAQKLDIALAIQVEKEKVEVQDQGTNLDVSPENNAGAIILKGKDLEALSDDPDELMTELQALAGPSAGPNGGQIYIDGFSGGQLPPKSSIREIRINQNPFSAEYDKVGYGRIEIFTKPGTNQWHGQSSINTTESTLNARNPFITTSVPPYYSVEANENVGGPLGKNGSLFFNADYRNIDDQS